MNPAASWSIPRLLVGIAITLVAALSVHAVMLQVLHIPFPSNFPRGGWPRVPDSVLEIAGAIYLSRLLPQSIRCRGLLARWLILFLLLATMHEVFFRAPFMNFINLSGFTLWPFLDNVPVLLPLLFVALCVEVWNQWSHGIGANLIAALAIGIASAFAIAPVARHLFAGVLAYTQMHEGVQRFGLPYGWQILVPAYLTFLEPVLAALWIGNAIRPQLPRSSVTRFLLTAALIIALKGPVFAPFVYIHYAGTSPVTATLSYGQFTFEAIVLGLLTAATLSWSLRPSETSAGFASKRERLSC